MGSMRIGPRAVLLGIVVALLVLFIVQNRQMLDLRFLGWQFEVRRAFLILAVFGAGFVSGWFTSTVAQLLARRRAAREKPEAS